jgi:hypothetical protein
MGAGALNATLNGVITQLECKERRLRRRLELAATKLAEANLSVPAELATPPSPTQMPSMNERMDDAALNAVLEGIIEKLEAKEKRLRLQLALAEAKLAEANLSLPAEPMTPPPVARHPVEPRPRLALGPSSLERI